MGAFHTEVEGEHGITSQQQFESNEAHFIQALRPATTLPPIGAVFEPLYASLVYAISSSVLASKLQELPPAQPTALVTWYYALYFATRAMFGAIGQTVEDTHTAAARSVARSLAQHLPHPFNMVATRSSGETYRPLLPTHPSAAPSTFSKQ
jgi:hypothetical protein